MLFSSAVVIEMQVVQCVPFKMYTLKFYQCKVKNLFYATWSQTASLIVPNVKMVFFFLQDHYLKNRLFTLCNAGLGILTFFRHLDPCSSTELAPTFLVKSYFLLYEQPLEKKFKLKNSDLQHVVLNHRKKNIRTTRKFTIPLCHIFAPSWV